MKDSEIHGEFAKLWGAQAETSRGISRIWLFLGIFCVFQGILGILELLR